MTQQDAILPEALKLFFGSIMLIPKFKATFIFFYCYFHANSANLFFTSQRLEFPLEKI